MNIIDRISRTANSFRSKQQMIIMLACIIVLVISLGSSLFYEAISFNRDSRARLGVLADIIAADISAALAFGDSTAIDKTMRTLSVDQSIIQLYVLDAQGELAGRYIRSDLPQAPMNIDLNLARIRRELTRTYFEFSPEVIRPVTYDGVHLGDILVEVDSDVFFQKLMVSGGIGAVILVISILGSFLLAKRLGRIVTEPVQSLTATMEEVSRTKNYHLRADVHGLTELSLLSNGFNEMLGEIAKRDEAILESEYRWKFALEGAGDGVWDWNIRTDESTYSKRWKEMLGYTDGDIMPVNQEWVDRIHPEDRSYVSDSMQAYLEGRTETYVVEYRLRCKDDSYIWILGRGMVVCRSEDGDPVRMLGTHTDITNLKQAELELRMKNADIEQFLYTVSHDLRTPLVTVKTFLGYLKDDMASGNQKRVAQDLQFIHGAADKMKMLLDELLEMSRFDRVESKAVKVSFSDVVGEVLDVMAGIINERQVDIHHPETDLMLFGDRLRLCRIWQNLIENAIKYSRNDSIPQIRLGLLQENGETVFFVMDNGIGIDPKYCTKIFGIFEKLDPKSPGAGLGLSLVQRIVEKYGGKIWVESTGSDKGSCFFFTLPQVVVQI
jgi:PAS domain S-box-containing protein